MSFFLVTGSIMGISIFLIYKICTFLGLELKWLSLVLCAVLAFAVNGVAIAFSPFLDQSHYVRLGIMVLCAAALVTLINELLLRHDRKAAIAASAGGPELVEIAEDNAGAEAPPKLAEPAAELPSAPVPEPAAAEGSPAGDALVPMAANTEAGARLSERLHDAMKANASEEYLEEVKALTTLDDLLDYAYAKKASEPDASVAAYRSAIRLFPDDSYTPFLIIELAGLFKEGARYAEAIDLYSEALSMPIIADDDAMVQEFERTLRYLGTVQDILNKHQAPATPFSQLSPELLQEVEDALAAVPAGQAH